MTEALSLNGFNELTYNDLYAIYGGDWLRTACGIVGGIIGGASAFVSTFAAASTVLFPPAAAVVATLTVPGGVATGYAAGTEFYDTLTKKK